MEDSTCLKDLQRRMSVEAMQRGPEGIKEADTALTILYNLCIDTGEQIMSYECTSNADTPLAEVQQAALKKDLHLSIFEYIHGRPWDFGEEIDEDLFENSILTLNEILQHKSEVNHPEHLTPKFTSEILRLPCIDGILDILFEAAALCIAPYLKDAAFQEALLNNRQLPLLWSLLEKAAFVAQIPNIETSSAPAIEKDILNTITQISLLPNFPDHLQSDYTFIRILSSACILTENDARTASKSICACILLGNFATTDENASEVVSKLDLVSLFDFISLKAYGRSKSSVAPSLVISSSDTNEPPHVPTDTVYLHAAGGMLRHISRPRNIREKHFTDPAALQASIALCQYSEPEVQIQGLRLFRNLLATNFITLTHSIDNHYTSSLIKVFTESDKEMVKLEVFRTVVRILNAFSSTDAWKPVNGQSNTDAAAQDHHRAKEDSLSRFLTTPSVAEPLVFAVTLPVSQSNPQTYIVQLEGWLGLVMLVSSGYIGRYLSEECFKRDEMFEALKTAFTFQSIDPQDKTTMLVPVVLDESSLSATQSQVENHAKSNAIAFAVQSVNDHALNDELRKRLQGLLSEAGIEVKPQL